MEPLSSIDLAEVTISGVAFVLISIVFGVAVGTLRAESFPGAAFASARLVCRGTGDAASYSAYEHLGRPYEDQWWSVLLKVVPVILGMTASELVWTWKNAATAHE